MSYKIIPIVIGGNLHGYNIPVDEHYPCGRLLKQAQLNDFVAFSLESVHRATHRK